MPSTCFISELLPFALICHFSHVWLEEIRNKLVKNVASESNSLWPSPLSVFLQSTRASFWGEPHGHLLISEEPAGWAYTVEQLFVSFDCDNSELALPVLSHQHCFLWLCFIHNNQGLEAVSSKEQASQSSHKFQPNTMFGSSSRLMTAVWGWSETQEKVAFMLSSVFPFVEMGDGLQVPRAGMWAYTVCHLPVWSTPPTWHAKPSKVYPQSLPLKIHSFLSAWSSLCTCNKHTWSFSYLMDALGPEQGCMAVMQPFESWKINWLFSKQQKDNSKEIHKR